MSSTLSEHCAHCGGQVEAAWKFCRSCGVALADSNGIEAGGGGQAEVPAPASSDSRELAVTTAPPRIAGGTTPVALAEPPAPARRRIPLTGIGLGIAVVAIIGLSALAFWLRTELVETESELAATANQLADTSDRLAETEADLESANTQVDTLTADLDATRDEVSSLTEERDGLAADLASAEEDLGRLEGTLAETQGDLQEQQQRATLQAGQIRVLRDCLQGVVESLYYASYEYWSLATAALEAVRTPCNQASALF